MKPSRSSSRSFATLVLVTTVILLTLVTPAFATTLQVTVAFPFPFQTVWGVWPFRAGASAPATDPISTIAFDIDGSAIGTATTYPYAASYDTALLSEGPHKVHVKAVTALNHSVEATGDFFVTHGDPTIESTPTVQMQFNDMIDIEHDPLLWWTNDLDPMVQFSSVNATWLASTAGYYYKTDRSPSTIPTVGSDQTPLGSPMLQQTLNMTDNALLYPSPMLSGETTSVEGVWWLHVRSFTATATGLSAVTASGRFGIDITKPDPVEQITPDVAGWSGVYRHRISWLDKAYQLWGPLSSFAGYNRGYDSLSGDSRWTVTVNDGTGTTYDRMSSALFQSFTVENGLHSGVNTITVQAVDHAGNRSDPRSTRLYIDSDVPTVTIAAPLKNATVGATTMFRLRASDGGGISKVEFFIDGYKKQSGKSLSMSYDTSYLTPGRHIISATVYDMVNRTASAAQYFYVVAPLTNPTDTADPFYPVIRDGNKDLATISIKSNRRIKKIMLDIVDGKGVLVRHFEATKDYAPGNIGWKWDGRDKNGNLVIPSYGTRPTSRTLRYWFTCDDYLGKRYNSAGIMSTTTARNYEIVRLSPTLLKIVPR